jgi:4-carboxymuconolactone decarboxylase
MEGAMQHAPHSLRQFMPAIILGANSNVGAFMTNKHAHPTDAAFQNGLAKRTQVMGQPFVDKAFDGATDFTLPMQHHITRAAWGDSWQRDALDLKTRSLITVAMLTALGKTHELKGHVRGALNNGATKEELQEVLLHAAIYCGVPTAVEGFRAAAEVVDGPKA